MNRSENFKRQQILAKHIGEEPTEQIIGLIEEAHKRNLDTMVSKEYVKLRFDSQDIKLEALEKRFDQRFQQIDNRYEQVDKRFEQVDKRFDLVEIRFEQVNKRFEQIDKRFEQIDKRFDKLDLKTDKYLRRLSWIIGIALAFVTIISAIISNLDKIF